MHAPMKRPAISTLLNLSSKRLKAIIFYFFIAASEVDRK